MPEDNATPQVTSNVQPTPTMEQQLAQQVKSQVGSDIPVEEVPIPSEGKVYPQKSPLHKKQTLTITAMTTREEDILTSRALLKKGTVITELVKSCLVDKAIDPLELLVGDRNTLMVAIRITGYGQEYDTEVECASCNTKTKQKFDLAQLPIQRLEIDPKVPGTNEFSFTLPMSKKNVSFKFLTGADELEISQTQEKLKKLKMQNDNVVTTNLLYSIVSIDGNSDRQAISTAVRKLPARDSLALRNYIKKNEPGIKMVQSVTCPSCDTPEEVNMPIGTSFLWPTE